ncbi:hypothetical protein AUEXF2481DRAFT_680469 [Aureobasidium subglaciale EXF-2481]|uniref:Uncharacterized protein n=1 Tax=Aureobasidium subglaciale (strain EXF-2481) TaxID=1043005 RepID=A0A074YD04_AURSE|nr:uncharacterized protein AUEXF2481DRAFT_680469 [Aureobasidium subglaciale EXF-2481]KEQ95658.1 hypothetical protein AUEXF2481DRAFT_680469 [Aureobasidium subglaciale EXF-2481]
MCKWSLIQLLVAFALDLLTLLPITRTDPTSAAADPVLPFASYLELACYTFTSPTTESVQPIMKPADVDGAVPVRPSPPTPERLTPEQVYAHAKAELERLVDLVKRERIGLLEIPASDTASSLVDIEQVLDDSEIQTSWMQALLRNHFQEHLQNEDPTSEEYRQVVEALDSSE